MQAARTGAETRASPPWLPATLAQPLQMPGVRPCHEGRAGSRWGLALLCAVRQAGCGTQPLTTACRQEQLWNPAPGAPGFKGAPYPIITLVREIRPRPFTNFVHWASHRGLQCYIAGMASFAAFSGPTCLRPAHAPAARASPACASLRQPAPQRAAPCLPAARRARGAVVQRRNLRSQVAATDPGAGASQACIRP